MRPTALVVFVLELAALGGAAWGADRTFRRRGRTGARVAVWSATGLVLVLFVAVPLVGLLLLWYLGHAE